MFSTDYNRKIAEQVNKINEDFIKHSKKVNRVGGGLLNVAQVDKSALGRPVGGAMDLNMDALEGGNIFKDVWHGIKSIFGGAIPQEYIDDVEGGKKCKCGGRKKKGKGMYEKDDLMEGGVAPPEVVKGGKKKGKKGGNFLDDLVDDVGKVAPLLPLVALGKPKKAVKKGGAKKTSKWIEHVKAFSKKEGMKYNEALKHPKCKATYKP